MPGRRAALGLDQGAESKRDQRKPKRGKKKAKTNSFNVKYGEICNCEVALDRLNKARHLRAKLHLDHLNHILYIYTHIGINMIII